LEFVDDDEQSDSGNPVDTSLHGEVKRWFEQKCENVNTSPYKWFKLNHPLFPRVAKAALDLLAVPGSSTPSERAFSLAKQIITPRRSSLCFDTVEALMCVHSWLHHDLRSSLNIDATHHGIV
jgi:hypothetical protein